jgi:hypothetical protein
MKVSRAKIVERVLEFMLGRPTYQSGIAECPAIIDRKRESRGVLSLATLSADSRPACERTGSATPYRSEAFARYRTHPCLDGERTVI